ncbi:MAG: hypothetical protein F6K00_10365 [Leptolyngbya sp. SIOISBB]|nr:hypothetical protein [Leptolyngbya sp. SIOISBB]
MADRTTQHLITCTGMASVPLFVAQGTLAHAGHDHSRNADAEPSAREQAAPEPESNTTDSEAPTPPAAEMPMDAAEPMPMPETAATEESLSATAASVPAGFSLGFGEPLLALIVVGPFLLRALKKQLHSR